MRYNHVFMISGVKMVSRNISRARCSEAISKPLVFISSLFGINYKERSRILYRLRCLSKAPLQHQLLVLNISKCLYKRKRLHTIVLATSIDSNFL